MRQSQGREGVFVACLPSLSPQCMGGSVVHLDHDEEMVSMRGMCGALDAELEAERTIKRAVSTAFLWLLRKIAEIQSSE